MKEDSTANYIELVIAVIIWGGTFVATKYALQAGISPILFAFTRFLIASLVFLPFAFYLNEKGQRLNGKELKITMLLGFLGITSLIVLQSVGLTYTTSINVALLITLGPIFTLFLSKKILDERIGFLKIVGIGLSFLGAVVVISNGSLDVSARTSDIIGASLVLISVPLWSLYTVIGKKVMEKHSAELVTSYSVLFGTLLMLPIVLLFDDPGKILTLKISHWIPILYAGLGSSVIAFLLWYRALKHVRASTASVFLYLEPLSTIVLANFILSEFLTTYILVGGLMIFLGVFLATREK